MMTYNAIVNYEQWVFRDIKSGEIYFLTKSMETKMNIKIGFIDALNEVIINLSKLKVGYIMNRYPDPFRGMVPLTPSMMDISFNDLFDSFITPNGVLYFPQFISISDVFMDFIYMDIFIHRYNYKLCL